MRYKKAQEKRIDFCQIPGTTKPIPKRETATPIRVEPLTNSCVISNFILNLPQQIKESAFFKDVGSLNYTHLKIENEIPTHEGAVAPARVLVSLGAKNIGLTENSFGFRQSAFCRPEFSQIAFGNFVKPSVMFNLRGRLQEGFN